MNSKIKFKKLVSKYSIKFDTDFSATVDMLKKSLGMSDATNKEISAKTNLEMRGQYLIVPWVRQILLGYLNKKDIDKFLDKLEINP